MACEPWTFSYKVPLVLIALCLCMREEGKMAPEVSSEKLHRESSFAIQLKWRLGPHFVVIYGLFSMILMMISRMLPWTSLNKKKTNALEKLKAMTWIAQTTPCKNFWFRIFLLFFCMLLLIIDPPNVLKNLPTPRCTPLAPNPYNVKIMYKRRPFNRDQVLCTT